MSAAVGPASAPALPPPSVEYLRVFDLPPASALPEELRGKVLFTQVDFKHSTQPTTSTGKAREEPPHPPRGGDGASTSGRGGPTGSQVGTSGKPKGQSAGGFNFAAALEGALKGAGTSVSSRGDGKFEGGKDFAVSDAPGGNAKFVHLGPDALTGANAEATLRQLDELQAAAGRGSALAAGAGGTAGAGPAPSGGAASGDMSSLSRLLEEAVAPVRSRAQQTSGAAAAAGTALYDISEESGPGAGPPGSGSSSSAAGSTGALPAATAPTLREPAYSLRDLPPAAEEAGTPGGGCNAGGGKGSLEVAVVLPEVEGPGEVEVWLGGGELRLSVPGKYRLQLSLPCPVVDDTSGAKWSRAKRRLTLALTKR
ncbi:hypothetical protein HYH03_016230 [Edaphochlamys debaryana]|uniref:PIH1D1/2/3 CS-like domain-containing protein n=1 Tax=Edaphochlamys debaryana TaxID=47281 RepID=A0A835XHZ2_9CHLO|nr:hypothetical protein HYH03_016230 [Edaphochlamys debaryana]|eukprot:KAG2485027.1 hypothetical protein HYH03_016230 [Edaphochlamys debaryana]